MLTQSFTVSWLHVTGHSRMSFKQPKVTSLLGEDPDEAAAIVRPSEVGVVREEGRDALLARCPFGTASVVERAATIIVANVRVSSVSQKQLD